MITLNPFRILLSIRCRSEGVEIRDGGTASSHLFDSYCGDKPDTIKSTGNVMYVKYFSTRSSPNIGFQAKVKVGRSCGNIIPIRLIRDTLK